MSKVVYLLGAGASFGKRKKTSDVDMFETIEKAVEQNNYPFSPPSPENHIKEGLPIVTEIPDRINYIIEQVNKVKLTDIADKIIFPKGQKQGFRFSVVKDQFIANLQWLQYECAAHATIDTFAKKLWLRQELHKYKKVECLLTIYFIIEQIINKPDSRYDTFFANILTPKLTIPDDISIITWNYDSQFEIAYKEYLDDSSEDNLIRRLKPLSRGDSIDPFFTPTIFKINGSATFKEMKSLGAFCGKGADQEITESILIELLNFYFISLDVKHESCKLSFAWEDAPEENKQYWLNLKVNTQDATSLVIIGYTFPFFNRNIDRALLRNMKNLKKIYIQDPNAKNLIQNIKPILSHHQASANVQIIPLTNVDQFYLPAELSI